MAAFPSGPESSVFFFLAWPVLHRVLSCHPLPVLSPLIFFRPDKLYEPDVRGKPSPRRRLRHLVQDVCSPWPPAIVPTRSDVFSIALYFFLLSCALPTTSAVLPGLPGIICLASTTVISHSLADAPMLAILSFFCIYTALVRSSNLDASLPTPHALSTQAPLPTKNLISAVSSVQVRHAIMNCCPVKPATPFFLSIRR